MTRVMTVQPDLLQPSPGGRQALAPGAIVDDLNPPQREAVLANDGPVLILAGAGSGKTRAITRKIAWLVSQEGYAPWDILAVTFTNRAAGEMRARCEGLLGPDADQLWLGTFHSIGVKVLRRHGELLSLPRSFVIYDRDDMKAMLSRVYGALDLDDKAFPLRAAMSYVDRAKQQCMDPQHANIPNQTLTERTFRRVYEAYELAMREAGAVDFGDLIYLPLRLFREHPLVASEYKARWRYVLVDEFQDTNHAQVQLLDAVLNDARRICVVGDDDQSIYSWRGADVSNILGFDQRYGGATVIRLEQNYRSSGHILDVAGALIARNDGRHPKTLWTDREPGEPVRMHEAESERGEAAYVVGRMQALRSRYDLEEMAIFYRTNAQSRSFEDALRKGGMAYRVVGGLRFYDRAEIKDLMAYLKVISNPLDVVGLERIINTPTRGIGKTSVQKVRAAAAEQEISLWDAIGGLADAGGALGRKLAPFRDLMVELREMARNANALEVLEEVLARTGYVDRLSLEGTAEADARMENIRELGNAIGEFVESTEENGVAGFLDQASLQTDLEAVDDDLPTVLMMTAHMAKGLEFDVVFLTGLEEGLFPHFNSQDSRDAVEEERRLCYVAMTRARHELHLSYALSRRRFGALKMTSPSRFIDGLPDAHLRWDGRTRRGQFAGYGGGQPAPTSWTKATSADTQAMPSYEDFSQDPGDYDADGALRPGTEIFHATFGEGIVQEIRGQGGDARVRVRFGDGRERTIVGRFLTRF